MRGGGRAAWPAGSAAAAPAGCCSRSARSRARCASRCWPSRCCRARPAAGLRLLRRARRPDAAGGGLVTDGTAALRVPTAAELAGFAYLSAVVTTIAFLLWYDAIGRLGADRAGLFAGLIPVSAVITTVVLGIDRPGPADLAGAALVAAGVVLGLRSRVAPVNPRFPSP